MGSSTFFALQYLKALPSAVLLNSITHPCPGLFLGTERVTMYKAGIWDRGELGFPVTRVCCGWIFLLPFPCPPAPPIL